MSRAHGWTSKQARPSLMVRNQPRLTFSLPPRATHNFFSPAGSFFWIRIIFQGAIGLPCPLSVKRLTVTEGHQGWDKHSSSCGRAPMPTAECPTSAYYCYSVFTRDGFPLEGKILTVPAFPRCAIPSLGFLKYLGTHSGLCLIVSLAPNDLERLDRCGWVVLRTEDRLLSETSGTQLTYLSSVSLFLPEHMLLRAPTHMLGPTEMVPTLWFIDCYNCHF